MRTKRKKGGRTGAGGSAPFKLLFIHQNFPSPYKNVASYYAAMPGVQVAAVGERANLTVREPVPNVALFGYVLPGAAAPVGDPLAADYDHHVRRGRAAAGILRELRDHGFMPDVICVNPDWGEGLFIRSVYPDTPILGYAEMYFHPDSPDLDFDPDFPITEEGRRLAMSRNAARAMTLADSDHLQTPTRWQHAMLPKAFGERASILHEGIDTDLAKPNSWATLTVPASAKLATPENAPLPDYVPPREKSLILDAKMEIVTFVSRTLEPFMGWHVFSKALPLIQKRHPEAHCVIVGRTSGGYGTLPPEGRNWRDIYLEEVHDCLDFSRIHFLGNISSLAVLKLLALSRAHVYLTYPHVLSRSPLEAMSCGAPLVASATGPVLEVARDGENALLVDFFSPGAVADAVSRLLSDAGLRARLGAAGRTHVAAEYDMKKVWLPRWNGVIRALARGEKVTAAW